MIWDMLLFAGICLAVAGIAAFDWRVGVIFAGVAVAALGWMGAAAYRDEPKKEEQENESAER